MSLLGELTNWQRNQAKKENIETYMVLPFATLKLISQIKPKNNEELLSIKGIGQIKVKKYGKDILDIIFQRNTSNQNNLSGFSHNKLIENFNKGTEVFDEFNAVNDMLDIKVKNFLDTQEDKCEIFANNEEKLKLVNISYPKESEKKEKLPINKETGEILENNNDIISVSDFLVQMNHVLNSYFSTVRIKGEVIGFKRNQNGHAYFELKDNEGIIRVSVFKNVYELSGVELADGVEVIITGKPECHKRYGFSFIGEFVELFGEGALKKAYDDLKRKLEIEGLFSNERKKPLPHLPVKIGLITSKTGAAIGDFTTNLGRYGFKVIFQSSCVEGQNSVKELLEAIKILENKDLDLLVITRGGGSLESLKAFNNENVVRAIANFSVPVIAGIGHEQDETLTTLVADIGVSTPTAAARAVRESWDKVVHKLDIYESVIVDKFQSMLVDAKKSIENNSNVMIDFFDNIFDKYSEYEHKIEKGILNIEMQLTNTMSKCKYFEKIFNHNNPLRQLKLGYSITKNKNGDIINDINTIEEGEKVDIVLNNGILETIITSKKDK